MNNTEYDKAYFLGKSERRGRFSLVKLSPKYLSRWQYCMRYVTRILSPKSLREKNEHGWLIADVGAGAANLARLVKLREPPEIKVKKVVSVDLSVAGYQLASFEEIRPKRAPFVQSNVARLPLRSGSVHMVVGWDLFEHLRDPERGLKECTRILKPGGILHLITPNPDSYRAGTEEDTYYRDKTHIKPAIISIGFFRGLLKKLGYTNVEVVTRGFPETRKYAQEHKGEDLFKPEGGTHIAVYAQKE